LISRSVPSSSRRTILPVLSLILVVPGSTVVTVSGLVLSVLRLVLTVLRLRLRLIPSILGLLRVSLVVRRTVIDGFSNVVPVQLVDELVKESHDVYMYVFVLAK
jgi:hypothetical protein